MQFKTLNGHLMAYRLRAGDGPTYVFVHALGCDQSLWDDVIAEFPRYATVLTYDLRGHGASEATHAPYSMDLLADDLIALIDVLGLSEVILCGISIGGMVAQTVALKRPDLLRGLCLSSTAMRIGTVDRWDTRIAEIQAGGIAAIADAAMGLMLSANFKATKPDAWAGLRAILMRNDVIGYCNACVALRDADLSADTPQITTPTVCITGAADQSVPPVLTTAIAEQIPNAKFITIPDASHLPCLETPVAVAAAILQLTQDTVSTVSRADAGDHVRRAVLGNAHVDRATAQQTEFDTAFQSLITEGAWGTVWASDAISRRERSMITLALLAALGNFDEIPMHIHASVRTGATRTDIKEALQHVAIYAGVPRANHALKLAKQTFAEMDADG